MVPEHQKKKVWVQ